MKKNILVVDDCEDVRVLLSMKLSNMGHSVYEACDGYEALNYLCEDCEIDLILMDIIMPKISGIELLQKIKEENKEINIVCISAHFDIRDAPGLIELGADEVIHKPIKNKTLEQKLSRFL